MKSKTLLYETSVLWLFALVKIPLVFWLKPRIMEMTDTRGVVMIRFRRRTKNHVNSMYFGAICVGSELAAGTLAMNLIKKRKEKYSFIIKDYSAEFLKRAEADVYFTCEQGQAITDAITKAHETSERQNFTLDITATVPSQFGDEPVAKFKLTLSIKQKI